MRTEYITGKISQRALAKKYGVSDSTLTKRANEEAWAAQRREARNKIAKKAQQKAADIIADNAVIAARIKTKLLRRLEREIDALPERIGTETRKNIQNRIYAENGGKLKSLQDMTTAYKLRDLTAAYVDLAEDIEKKDGGDYEDLNPLVKLLEDDA